MSKNPTVLELLLSALIPYTQENLKFSFKPSSFFYEMQRATGSNQNSLRSTMSRAHKRGLVRYDEGVPILTLKGLTKIKPYKAEKIDDGYLMVIFDIPENQRKNRDKLRQFLRILDFAQRQKSVWISTLDHRHNLNKIILELRIEKYVQIYECSRINID